jgi:hypothetical protein
VNRILFLSLLLWLASLLAGAFAILLADFGGPVWAFVLLLTWLVTVGLPTTLALVASASLWKGGGLFPFLWVAAAAGLLAQFAGVAAARRLWLLRRSARPPMRNT